MRMIARALTVAACAALSGAPGLAAQEQKSDAFTWGFGPQVGVIVFETPTQTRGAIFSAGAHVLIKARRTGLFISVDEGLSSNETTAFTDATAPGGTRGVLFNDLRKYSAVIVAFPFKSALQPYLGAGFGILQVVKPRPQGFLTPAEQATAEDTATNKGSFGFGTFVLGLQGRAGGISLFGQGQITTSPARGKLLTGPSISAVGGVRVSFGSAREGVSGGGY